MEKRMRACPAVSVIIPMYNVEKYVGECLDSLLAQTFTEFEIIVVDDCSTDSSCAIVEGYHEKFDGRLTLTRMKENSGGGGEPRNRGLNFSRGEYVFFMDADDVLMPTGLEEMYTLAKTFDADTVYCEKYFMSTGRGQEFVKNIHPAKTRIQNPPFVDEPTVETTDLAERVKRAINFNYWVTPWLRLVSRNLLVEHDIKFPSLVGSNDVGWTFKVLFCAKRFLRVPNACYIRRMHKDSVSLRKRTAAQHVHKWMDRTIRSLRDMDDFMASIEFFRKEPAYRYAVINNFVEMDFGCILNACPNESPFAMYNIFREQFGDKLGDHDVLVAALCSFINTQQKIIVADRQRFDQFAAQSQRELRASRQQFKELAEQVQQVIDELEQKN